MNVSLTPELESLVREKVETGMYQTASEVVREALREAAGVESAPGRRASLQGLLPLLHPELIAGVLGDLRRVELVVLGVEGPAVEP